MFVDQVQLRVTAGKGGDGLTSFRRERYVAKGGPDGGDGGIGGSIIFRAENNVNTLGAFRHHQIIKAVDGENGKRRRQHGRNGEDAIVRVPVGTVVYEGEEKLADLTEVGQTAVLASGGRGGFGNAHFTSSVRQAPRIAELGEAGEEKQLNLELKLIADVGLVGLPNAGKSTFISVVSSAKPEIADYPFTTLTPHLGVADIDGDSLLIADIPGLIEGASQGKGLGDEFLRHIERTAVILHLIDATQEDPVQAYKTIQRELQDYRVDLSQKPQLVLLTKADLLDAQKLKLHSKALKTASKAQILPVSAVAHIGVTEVLRAALKLVKTERAKPVPEEELGIPELTLADDPNAWWVEVEGKEFVVKGQKIEGFAKRTDMQNDEGVARLRNILHKFGIDRELVRSGVNLGDTVKIANKKFKW